MPSIYDNDNDYNENGKRYSATHDSMYPEVGNEDSGKADQYRNSPNYNERQEKDYDHFRYGSSEALHKRFSSSDSLENRTPDHSRQSSGSGAEFIPTSQRVRKTSAVAHNPLQFIAPGTNNLSEKAKEVIEKMEEQKIVKPVIEEEDNAWQDNLSNWKQKMRRKSQAAYQRTHDAEEMDRDLRKPEAEPAARRKAKTFKEMMEEKQKRQRSFNIYPLDDEDDFKIPARKDSTSFDESQNGDSAKSIKDSEEYDAFGIRKVKKEDKKTFRRDSSSVLERWKHKGEEDRIDTNTSDRWKRSPSQEKQDVQLQSLHPQDKEENRWKRSPSQEKDEGRWKRSPSQEKDEGRWKRSPSQDKEESRWKRSPSKEKEESWWKKSSTEDENKISIGDKWRKKQEEKEDYSKTGANKWRKEERELGRISVGERWKKKQEEKEKDSPPEKLERIKVNPNAWSWKNRASNSNPKERKHGEDDNINEYVPEWAREDTPEETKLNRWSDPPQTEEGIENNNDNKPEKSFITSVLPEEKSAKFSSIRSSFENSRIEREKESSEERAPPKRRTANVVKPSHEHLYEDRIKEQKIEPVQVAPPVYSAPPRKEKADWGSEKSPQDEESEPSQKKNFVEKVIKIKQKPNNSRGFGFTIKGGKEYKEPVVVQKVSLGSAADVCELLTGDEIVSVNGAEVGGHYQESVMHVINNAVKDGQLELKIKRFIRIGEDSFDEYEAMMDSEWQEEEASIQPKGETGSESPTESLDSYNSADELLEQQIMEQLEAEAAKEEDMQHRHERTMLEEASDQLADVSHNTSLLEEASDQLAEVSQNTSLLEEANDQLADVSQNTSLLEEASDQLADVSQNMSLLEEASDQPPGVSTAQALSEEDQWGEEDARSDDSSQSAPLAEMEGDEDEAPPALPAAPPPEPNWNTFPESNAPVTDLSFLDSSDLLPDQVAEVPNDNFGREGDILKTANLDQNTKKKIESLRRRSEFLGVNLEDLDEYKKLQAEKEREEQKREEQKREEVRKEAERAKVKAQMTSEQRWGTSEQPTRDIESTKPTHRTFAAIGMRNLAPRSEFDLDLQEKEIIENLEREERERQERERQDMEKTNQMRPWKSSESLRSRSEMSEMEERVTRDVESVMLNQKPSTREVRPSRSFIDFEEEQRKMAEWDEEQEKKRQPGDRRFDPVEIHVNLGQERFAQDQNQLRKKFDEDLKQSEMMEAQKREQEQKMLEKELKHQRELEELRQKQLEEREKQRKEDEERRKKEEEKQRKEEAERKRKEEQKRKREEEELKKKLSQRAHQIQVDTEKIEAAAARSQLARKNKSRVQDEVDADVQREKERLFQEEEARKNEEERRRLEESEAQILKDKEDQLRAMEERIRREAEQLILERKRFQLEKENRQRAWGMGEPDPNNQTHFSKPLEIEIGKPTYTIGEVKMDHIGPSHAKLDYIPGDTGNGKPSVEYDAKRGSHTPPEKLEETRPQFQVQIQTDPSRKLIIGKPEQQGYPAKYDPYNNGNNQRDLVQHSRSQSDIALHKKAPMPIAKKPLNLKTQPPLPAPKPSTAPPRSADVVTRRSVLELNKRPAGGAPAPAPPVSEYEQYRPETSRSMEEIRFQRPTFEMSPKKRDESGRYSYAVLDRSPNRDGQSPTRVPSRKSWHEESQGRETSPSYQGNDAVPMTKRSLHTIGAPPTRKLFNNEEWIKPDDDRKRRDDGRRPQQRHSDIMKAAYSSSSQHWVVEEAERRRLADQAGRERLQNRHNQMAPLPGGYNQYPSGPPRDDPYNQGYDMNTGPSGAGSPHYRAPPTHVMEHVEAPADTQSRPSRPIPEAIKQTLLQRTMSPKSPRGQQGPPSPSYHAQYGHYPHSPSSQYQVEPPSQYSNQSPGQYPEDYRQYPHQAVPYTGTAPNSAYPPMSSSGYNPSDMQRPPYDPKVPPAKPPRSLPVSTDEAVSRAEAVSVSGQQRCNHCEQELGLGAAMIIESLNLCYHVECFRCYVCRAPLGSGQLGADVRVRVSKLHCHNCYSNDEVGLKYSRV